MKNMMDEVLEQEATLIGLVKDMQDRERRMYGIMETITVKLKDLKSRIEKLEGQNDE